MGAPERLRIRRWSEAAGETHDSVARSGKSDSAGGQGRALERPASGVAARGLRRTLPSTRKVFRSDAVDCGSWREGRCELIEVAGAAGAGRGPDCWRRRRPPVRCERPARARFWAFPSPGPYRRCSPWSCPRLGTFIPRRSSGTVSAARRPHLGHVTTEPALFESVPELVTAIAAKLEPLDRHTSSPFTKSRISRFPSVPRPVQFQRTRQAACLPPRSRRNRVPPCRVKSGGDALRGRSPPASGREAAKFET